MRRRASRKTVIVLAAMVRRELSGGWVGLEFWTSEQRVSFNTKALVSGQTNNSWYLCTGGNDVENNKMKCVSGAQITKRRRACSILFFFGC